MNLAKIQENRKIMNSINEAEDALFHIYSFDSDIINTRLDAVRKHLDIIFHEIYNATLSAEKSIIKNSKHL